MGELFLISFTIGLLSGIVMYCAVIQTHLYNSGYYNHG